MASYSCNGICHRHPCYSPKRLKGSDFIPVIDALCRKCEAYYKKIKDARCPCCKQKLSRHLRKGRAFKNKVFTAFADFWRMILRESAPRKKKDVLFDRTKWNRKCIKCNSSKTFKRRGNFPLWCRFKDGWICSNCYNENRRMERREAKIKKKMMKKQQQQQQQEREEEKSIRNIPILLRTTSQI